MVAKLFPTEAESVFVMCGIQYEVVRAAQGLIPYVDVDR